MTHAHARGGFDAAARAPVRHAGGVHGIEFLRDVLTERPEETPPSLDAVPAISSPFVFATSARFPAPRTAGPGNPEVGAEIS